MRALTVASVGEATMLTASRRPARSTSALTSSTVKSPGRPAMVSFHSGSCRRNARTKSIRRSILLFLAKRPIDKIDFWNVLEDAS